MTGEEINSQLLWIDYYYECLIEQAYKDCDNAIAKHYVRKLYEAKRNWFKGLLRRLRECTE